MIPLIVLIGCEESQAVCLEFRRRGHIAFSCDLQECSGGHPEWHLQMDIFEAIKLIREKYGRIDRLICFPDCTYLTISANKWYKEQPPRKSGVLVGEARARARARAIEFVKRLADEGANSIENPVGVLSTVWRKPDQVLQPWMFGHGETKATCLWLNGVPKLVPTNIVEGREQRLHRLPKTKDRAKLRSKTFPGIARAIGEQWSPDLGNTWNL